jgi:hypothetical protein
MTTLVFVFIAGVIWGFILRGWMGGPGDSSHPQQTRSPDQGGA